MQGGHYSPAPPLGRRCFETSFRSALASDFFGSFLSQYATARDDTHNGRRDRQNRALTIARKALHFAMAIDLTAEVLDALSQTDKPILSTDAFPSTPSSEIKSALDRLKSREMVVYEAIDRDEAVLTSEAEDIAANGSHEAKVFEAVLRAVEGMKMADLPVCWLNCMPGRLDAR